MGLSLLELTFVTLAIGVIAVAGSLRYADALTRHRLQAAGKAIAAEWQGLAAMARTRNQTVTITVDPAMETFTVTGVENPDGPSRPYVVNVLNRFSVGIDRSDFPTATPLSFNAFGHPNRGGSLVLKLHGSERSVTVDASQGTIQAP